MVEPTLEETIEAFDRITKGDYPGHPFRGNQWTGGISRGGEGGAILSRASAKEPAPKVKAVVFSDIGYSGRTERQLSVKTLTNQMDKAFDPGLSDNHDGTSVTQENIDWALEQRGDPGLMDVGDREDEYGVTTDDHAQWIDERFPRISIDSAVGFTEDFYHRVVLEANLQRRRTGTEWGDVDELYTDVMTSVLQAVDEMSSLYPSPNQVLQSIVTRETSGIPMSQTGGALGFASARSSNRSMLGLDPRAMMETARRQVFSLSGGEVGESYFESLTEEKMRSTWSIGEMAGSFFMPSNALSTIETVQGARVEALRYSAYSTVVHEWGHLIDYTSIPIRSQVEDAIVARLNFGGDITRRPVPGKPLTTVPVSTSHGPTEYATYSAPESIAESFASRWLGFDDFGNPYSRMYGSYTEAMGTFAVFDNAGNLLTIIEKAYAMAGVLAAMDMITKSTIDEWENLNV